MDDLVSATPGTPPSSTPHAKRLAIKFLLSNSLTGSLIGAKGKSIKELIALTDARIHVSSTHETYPGTTDRVILVSGSKEAVSLAQTLIWEMIGLMQAHARDNGGDTRLVEWDPRAAFESLGSQDESVEVSARFTIPAAAGGAVLGKGGETIRAFASESGARLAMSSKDEALFTQERVLTVSGNVNACIACTDMVLGKLHEQEEVAQFVNRGTAYASPLTSQLSLLNGTPLSPPPAHPTHHMQGYAAPMFPSPHNLQQSRLVSSSPVTAGIVAESTITLSVPEELAGNLFGRGGATMREIIALSGAKVVVSPRGEEVSGIPPGHRLVTISGHPTAAQTAHLFVTQRLQTPAQPAPVPRPRNTHV